MGLSFWVSGFPSDSRGNIEVIPEQEDRRKGIASQSLLKTTSVSFMCVKKSSEQFSKSSGFVA